MQHAEKSNLMRNLAFWTIVASATLSGCVSNAPKPTSEAATNPAIAVTSEVRADFDAAMALMKAEEYQNGIELMNKVVERSPNHPVPFVNLGIAHTKLGDLKAAEENLKTALKLDPDNPVANNEYALVYRKTGRFTEARQVYEMMLAKYPYYPLVHKNLGILCDIYLRDYECALREYEFYSEAKPDDKDVTKWVADVQRRLGK